jgi:hypothetical protein
VYSELEAIVDKLAKETENMVNQTKLGSVVTIQPNQSDSVVTSQPYKT